MFDMFRNIILLSAGSRRRSIGSKVIQEHKSAEEKYVPHKAAYEVLAEVRTALVKLKHSLPEEQAAIITDQALLESLKGGLHEHLELKKIRAVRPTLPREEWWLYRAARQTREQVADT